jgi:hypothetical protein
MTLTFIALARKVLETAKAPLLYQEIWHAAVESGLAELVPTRGKTPESSVGAQLYVSVKSADSEFMAVGKRPTRFWLTSRAHELAKLSDAPSKSSTAPAKPSWTERDMHPLLAHFGNSHPNFVKGRRVLMKTIRHENAKKSGVSSWVFPDVVGVYLPFEDWETGVFEFAQLCSDTALKLYSFELKRNLDRGNYRESFFQAVSNSSWAHEGYLVVGSIAEDDDLRREVDRLSASFGIGLILLDVTDPDASQVLAPARERESLEWETINKLAAENPDFRRFLDRVRIDVSSSFAHPQEYDAVVPDVHEYIAAKGMTVRS